MTTPFQESIDRIANRGGAVDSRDLLQFTEALRDELSGVVTRIRQLEIDLRRDLGCKGDRSMDLELLDEVLDREIRAAKAAVTPQVPFSGLNTKGVDQ